MAVTRLALGGEVAVLTLDSPPVNALSAALRAGIVQGVRQAMADPAAKTLVLICAGKTFVAGADIAEFGRPPQPPSLAEVLELIEGSPKPVLAAIHGTALGGGLELAMACHYRIAAPSAQLGLPEVKLGLIPGGGGTQRLPRLVGVPAALEMIATGEPVGAPRALALGLIDRVAEGDLLEAALAYAQDLRTIRRTRDLAVDAADPASFDAARALALKTRRGFLAPKAAIAAVEAAQGEGFRRGLAEERRLFEALRDGPQSAAQRYLFFAERQAAKVADIPPDTPLRPIRTVGVVGAGTMGAGIAMAFANAGLSVILTETAPAALDRGRAVIAGAYARQVDTGRLSADEAARRQGRIAGAVGLAALADCDLIVEAVFEDMAVKTAVFRELGAVARPGAILATNTSYLDVDALAAATGRPESVLGLHFFSPAQVMRLVEVVRGAATAPDVVATAMQLARTLGKVGVLVGVRPGFVANAMQARRQAQANRLIVEGAAPQAVDRVLYDFGMPMGPFAMIDMAGLDIGWFPGKPAATVRDRLCEMGRLGRKTGAGFYDYGADDKPRPSPVTAQAIEAFAAETGVARRAVSDQEILERCLFASINEGARILQEGKAQRASDIDVAWVGGFGWPAYRGGPMHYADSLGLDVVLAGLRRYEGTVGPEFAPAPLIETLAAEGRRFSDL